MKLVAIVIVAALAFAACAAPGDGARVSTGVFTPTPAPTKAAAIEASPDEATETPRPTKTKSEKGAGGWTGVHANNYRNGATVCKVFSQRKLARDLGLGPNAHPVDIAEAFSEAWRPAFRQAPFEGCLKGMRQRK